jgi:hypothetical protein
MHKVLVKEQAAPQPEKSISDQLQGFITNGCAKNGKVVKMKSTNPQKQFAIKQESTKTPGKFRYLFIDNTIGMNDETGKFKILPNKWACDQTAINQSTSIENQKNAFITKARNLGYKTKEDLTANDVASGEFKKTIVPGSQEYFPPNGLEMYWSPSNLATANIDVSTAFEELSKLQTINKSSCKDAIRAYYEAYKTKKDIPQITFDPMKNVVQSCVNTYTGKWGGLLGLGEIKNYVEILQGKQQGGPSIAGEDSKWRLK